MPTSKYKVWRQVDKEPCHEDTAATFLHYTAEAAVEAWAETFNDAHSAEYTRDFIMGGIKVWVRENGSERRAYTASAEAVLNYSAEEIE